MRRRDARAGASVLALLLLGGCSAQLGDRGGQEGAPPDRIGDVDRVEVFRNADEFPNVARVCVEGIAFAATSSGGPSLVRVPEWDARCPAAAPATGTAPTSAPAPTSALAPTSASAPAPTAPG